MADLGWGHDGNVLVKTCDLEGTTLGNTGLWGVGCDARHTLCYIFSGSHSTPLHPSLKPPGHAQSSAPPLSVTLRAACFVIACPSLSGHRGRLGRLGHVHTHRDGQARVYILWETYTQTGHIVVESHIMWTICTVAHDLADVVLDHAVPTHTHTHHHAPTHIASTPTRTRAYRRALPSLIYRRASRSKLQRPAGQTRTSQAPW